MKHFIVVDGASSGNGLGAGIGVVIKDEKGNNIHTISEDIGEKTNNEAEYEAVIRGLEYAKENNFSDVVVLTDSNLVFNQVNGNYKVKVPNLRILLNKVSALINEFKSFVIDYVPREYSHEADELARIASERGVNKMTEKKYPFLTKSE